MWFWQLKIAPKIKFLLKLFFLSLLIHIFLLFFVVIYRGSSFSYHIEIKTDENSAIPIIFCPFQKRTGFKKKVNRKSKKQPPAKKPKTIMKPKKETKKKVSDPKLVKKNNIVKKKKEKLSAKKELKKEEALYVGQLELDALQIQEIAQQEISKHWKPPLGLSSDLTCKFKVIVDWNGKIKKIDLIKASSVLTYNLCARSAIIKSNFPKETFGREFIVEFKQ